MRRRRPRVKAGTRLQRAVQELTEGAGSVASLAPKLPKVSVSSSNRSCCAGRGKSAKQPITKRPRFPDMGAGAFQYPKRNYSGCKRCISEPPENNYLFSNCSRNCASTERSPRVSFSTFFCTSTMAAWFSPSSLTRSALTAASALCFKSSR